MRHFPPSPHLRKKKDGWVREKARRATYRWVAGRLLSLASLIAQPTQHRPLHSDVRAYLAAWVNRKVMVTNYRVVDPYQSMEQQP